MLINGYKLKNIINKHKRIKKEKVELVKRIDFQIGYSLNTHFKAGNIQAFMQIINKLISAYGVTHFSKISGIDRVTLWRFMKGDRLPRVDIFRKILEELGIQVQFSFDERMLKFVEYMHSKQQWECELKKHSGSAKSINHHAEQLKQEVSA